jgi:hypothetical protein
MRGVFFQTTFTAPAPQFSRDIISREFPFDSGTKEVNSWPKRLIKPSTISELRTQYQQGIQHMPWLRPDSEPNIRNQLHQLYPQASLMLLIYGGMQTSTLLGKCRLSQQMWWHWVQNLLSRRLLIYLLDRFTSKCTNITFVRICVYMTISNCYCWQIAEKQRAIFGATLTALCKYYHNHHPNSSKPFQYNKKLWDYCSKTVTLDLDLKVSLS